MHADFLRVAANQAIVVNVPLHFINEETCVGVKMQGGRISHSVNEIEIRCMPDKLPEYIEVDMIDVETGQVVHLSDLTLPEGVESVQLAHDHDISIANVAAPKGGSDDDEGAGDAAADDAAGDAGDDAGGEDNSDS